MLPGRRYCTAHLVGILDALDFRNEPYHLKRVNLKSHQRVMRTFEESSEGDEEHPTQEDISGPSSRVRVLLTLREWRNLKVGLVHWNPIAM